MKKKLENPKFVKGRLRSASPPPALALCARTGTAAGLPGKPGKPSAVENAPEELVAEERGKLLDAESLLKTHREHLLLFQ